MKPIRHRHTQYERIRKQIWNYLRGCEHAMELHLSPRLEKLRSTLAEHGARTLMDIELRKYDSLEAALNELIAEGNFNDN